MTNTLKKIFNEKSRIYEIVHGACGAFVGVLALASFTGTPIDDKTSGPEHTALAASSCALLTCAAIARKSRLRLTRDT